MPPDTALGTARRAISSLDHRVEAATGHDVDTLWAYRDRGILDEPHARLVDLHRALAQAETSVIFHRTLLHRLTSGEFPVDAALLARIGRTTGQLEEAVGERDAAAARLIGHLEPIETAARSTQREAREPLPAADQAALLAIAGGAKLHEHLVTGRMSVATASGTRVPYAHLQRLESAGLVSRDASHPVHAGQPLALTDAGRAALAGRRRASTTAAPASARPGGLARRHRAPPLIPAHLPKGPMPPPEPDFRLDDFEAADERTEETFWHAIAIEQDMLTALAEHHTPDGAHSFYVLHNGAVTWGIPGEPQLVALHLQRDVEGRRFRFEHAELPLPAMAQSWLIHRGCPRDAIALHPDTTTAPADETTRALEQRLMGDGDHFALLHSYTRDDPDDMTTLVVLRALDERSPAPFRVLHEEVDTDAGTHTLREGGFATAAEALQWCDKRLGGQAAPLPPVRLTARSTRPSSAVPAAPVQRPPGHSR